VAAAASLGSVASASAGEIYFDPHGTLELADGGEANHLAISRPDRRTGRFQDSFPLTFRLFVPLDGLQCNGGGPGPPYDELLTQIDCIRDDTTGGVNHDTAYLRLCTYRVLSDQCHTDNGNPIDVIAELGDGNDTATVGATLMPDFQNELRTGLVAVDGGNGEDTLSGSVGSAYFGGGDGSDVISSGAGDDWLAGGSGADVLRGGTGDDTLYANSTNSDSQRDVLRCGPGVDTAYVQPNDVTYDCENVQLVQ
jgi:hypothetical protein